ncbi:MAG: tetratricopeptide repeat protein [Ktedonobacteraceae bacterium]|jgi:tetratricopeptide (TPR) repeat protein
MTPCLSSSEHTLFILKRYEEALSAFQQAIDLDPNYADAYNGLGNTLMDLQQYMEAVKAFQKAKELGYT